MHKTEFIGTTLAGMMLLSGCSTLTKPTSSPTVSAEDLPTPTVIVPTEQPTTEPTVETQVVDEFANYKECFTWRDARENCVVSYDDLMSGKLVDYAKKVTRPFPDDAYELKFSPVNFTLGESYRFVPLLDEGLTLDEATIQWLYGGSKWNVNNDVFSDPRSPVGETLFFWVKGDGTSNLNFDVLAEIVKVNNQDGSDGYYTVILYPNVQMDGTINEENTATTFDNVFNKQAYQPPYRKTIFTVGGQVVSVFEKQGKFMLRIANDETSQTLLDQWAATGIIPKELEKRPLVANCLWTKEFPWAK